MCAASERGIGGGVPCPITRCPSGNIPTMRTRRYEFQFYNFLLKVKKLPDSLMEQAYQICVTGTKDLVSTWAEQNAGRSRLLRWLSANILHINLLCHLEKPERRLTRMRRAKTNVFLRCAVSFTFKFVLTIWSIDVATIVEVLRVRFRIASANKIPSWCNFQ